MNGVVGCTGAALAFKTRKTQVRQDDTDGETGQFRPKKRAKWDFTSLALPHGNRKVIL